MRYAVLEPGAFFEPPGDYPCEAGYLLLAGQVEWARTKVVGPAAFLCAGGATDPVANNGPRPAQLLYVGVEVEARPSTARARRVEAVAADRLTWRAAIHGGVGRIATRHIWGPEDFDSTWTFYDHAVLAPDSSVGYHYHDALEECFIMLAGRGYMTIDDETFAVGPGSVTWQGIGQGHGIYNPHPEELDFVRLAVAQPGRAYTTVDLHDDLAARRP